MSIALRRGIKGPGAHVSSSVHPGLPYFIHPHAYWHVSSCRSCLNPGFSQSCPQNFLEQTVLTVMFSPISLPKNVALFSAPYRESQKCKVGLPKAPQLRHLTELLCSLMSLSKDEFQTSLKLKNFNIMPSQHNTIPLQEHSSEESGSTQGPSEDRTIATHAEFSVQPTQTREF